MIGILTMRRIGLFVLLSACLTALLSVSAVRTAAAQNSGSVLVGRALLPADTQADGPGAGSALANQGEINGIRVPFDFQPVGTITGIAPSDSQNVWYALTRSQFETSEQSTDFLVRIYAVDVDFASGQATPLDWWTLSDPNSAFETTLRNSTATAEQRYLVGADLTVTGLQWLGNRNGYLITNDEGDSLLFDPRARYSGTAGTPTVAVPDLLEVYPADVTVNGYTNISESAALVIENDGNFKRVFLFDRNSGTKTEIIDLLNISDPNGISTQGGDPADAVGLGAVFTFPFSDIAAIYPIDAQTVMIVNNNHVPFHSERSPSQADATEFIAVQVAITLPVDPELLPQ
jgi:hypothetical protein